MKSLQEKLKSLEQEAMREERTIAAEIMKNPSKYHAPMHATVVMQDQSRCDVFNGVKPIIDELAFCSTMVSLAAIAAWTLVNFNRKVR